MPFRPELAGPGPLAGALHRELDALTAECVHCGFCLPACPTWVELGREPDSPRGRIHLARGLARGRIELTEPVRRHLDLCLDCRACESACPSGVRYGEIIEGVRAITEPHRRRPWLSRMLRRIAFRRILPSRRWLAVTLLPLRVLQVVGAIRLLQRPAVTRWLPPALREPLRLVPYVSMRSFVASAPARVPAEGQRRGRVVLFAGCVMDHTMAEVHRATVRVLARNGFEVAIPREQTCCGALHVHAGDRECARGLARRNVATLGRGPADPIVVNSAGCGAQLREYGRLLAEDPEHAAGARELAARAVDVSAFLARAGLRPPARPIPRRAAYDEPCHLLHGQGVSAEPRALLDALPGLEVVPLEEAESCCGSAGIYNLTENEMSRRLLRRKIDHVVASGADLLVTANPGCLFQLRAGVRERGLPVDVVHLIELLDRAYGKGDIPV